MPTINEELKTSKAALPYARVGHEYAKGSCLFHGLGLATATGDGLFVATSLLTGTETPEKAVIQIAAGVVAVAMFAISRSQERRRDLFFNIANQIEDDRYKPGN